MEMVKKYILLFLTYIIPVEFIPIVFSGITIKYSYLGIFLISLILAGALLLLDPIFNFLTVKENIITKFLLCIAFMYGAVYVIITYIKIIEIQNGKILTTLVKGTIYQTYLHFSLTNFEIITITSIILAIWGIIMTILI